MFTVDITKFVPNFLLADKNGYAIAMAFQAALQMMNDIISDGVDCVIDYDTMPEWRLDELAWELNCLYDYNADIEVKRDWIKNAIPYYRLYGTPQAITKYIGSYFDSIELEENWVYSGSPYHFRVTVDGENVPFTKTEYGLLKLLMENRGRVFSREELIKQVWPDDVIVLSRTVDVNITRLRKKIGPYASHIATHAGFGYSFTE